MIPIGKLILLLLPLLASHSLNNPCPDIEQGRDE
jgi:hypothetical protein